MSANEYHEAIEGMLEELDRRNLYYDGREELEQVLEDHEDSSRQLHILKDFYEELCDLLNGLELPLYDEYDN